MGYLIALLRRKIDLHHIKNRINRMKIIQYLNKDITMYIYILIVNSFYNIMILYRYIVHYLWYVLDIMLLLLNCENRDRPLLSNLLSINIPIIIS